LLEINGSTDNIDTGMRILTIFSHQSKSIQYLHRHLIHVFSYQVEKKKVANLKKIGSSTPNKKSL
jgi:hypothetical protein